MNRDAARRRNVPMEGGRRRPPFVDAAFEACRDAAVQSFDHVAGEGPALLMMS